MFLDRDGVINRARTDHVKSWSEFEFLPRALEALVELHRSGARLAVVTNQSAVGRGLLRAEELASIHERMRRTIQSAGGDIEGIFVCPHAPAAGCACRKPGNELFMRAGAELGLTLPGAFMVGDSWSDVQAAVSVGAFPILVAQGLLGPAPSLVPVVHDLYEATVLVLAKGRQPEPARR